ncbi:MAG TPA: hypothetical protein VFG96_06990 [Jiangellaceae bacterium]|nr:hypothetical protein [Jiangellaceae bacterium]
MTDHLATLPGHRDPDGVRRARNLRRVGIVALLVFVATGLVGILGPRTSDVAAEGSGYRLVAHHAQVTRSGLATPLRIEVSHAGGFDAPVTLAFDKDLFDRLDFQNFYPNPASETAAPHRIMYEFDPPGGEILSVTLDARTGPTQPPSAHWYWVAVLDDGREVAQVRFRMVVLP